jgi:hypothetical protein
MKKIKRNDPCPCGSGKKFKKCCILQQTSDQSFSWKDNDGIHFAAPGSPPSPEQLEKMTKEYQKQIRNSPLYLGDVFRGRSQVIKFNGNQIT